MSTREYWEKIIVSQKEFIDMAAIECSIQDYVTGNVSREMLPSAFGFAVSGLKYFNLPAAAVDAANKIVKLVSMLAPDTKATLERITARVNTENLHLNKDINDLSGSFDLFEIEYPFIEYSNGVKIMQGKGTIKRAHSRNGHGWTGGSFN